MNILEAVNIAKSYDGVTIIDQINIALHPGEIVCLLGVSGGGKTTLFNVLSGLSAPDRGQVLLNGGDITGKAGHLSYMLQKDLLMPYRTVLDNIALPLRIRGVSKKEARSKAALHFEEFGLSGTEKQYPAQLSGGMRQRAALLRTYLCSEGVALLDEPFSALDALTKKAIQSWYLDVMKRIELSTLFITHDIDEAILLSDRIYILSGKPGTITAELELQKKKRQDSDYSLTEEFLEQKRNILRLLQLN